MRHSPGVDLGEIGRLGLPGRPARFGWLGRAGGNARPHAVGNLHPEQKLHLETRFVKQIADTVSGFGDLQAAIPECGGPSLIGIEQGPQGDTAIDHVFAVIAGVVPAAGDVERIAASRPFDPALVASREASGDFLRMPRRPRPCCTDQPRLDRHARALVIEKCDRVSGERRIHAFPDREGIARRTFDDQAIAFARRAEIAEVDPLDCPARCRILPERLRLALPDGATGGVVQRPGQRRRSSADDRDLGIAGLEADLVEMDRQRRRGSGTGQQKCGSRRQDRSHHISYFARPANSPKVEPTKPPAVLVVSASVVSCVKGRQASIGASGLPSSRA